MIEVKIPEIYWDEEKVVRLLVDGLVGNNLVAITTLTVSLEPHGAMNRRALGAPAVARAAAWRTPGRRLRAACIAQIAQVTSLLAAAHDVIESFRVEGVPMYSEQRP